MEGTDNGVPPHPERLLLDFRCASHGHKEHLILALETGE